MFWMVLRYRTCFQDIVQKKNAGKKDDWKSFIEEPQSDVGEKNLRLWQVKVQPEQPEPASETF